MGRPTGRSARGVAARARRETDLRARGASARSARDRSASRGEGAIGCLRRDGRGDEQGESECAKHGRCGEWVSTVQTQFCRRLHHARLEERPDGADLVTQRVDLPVAIVAQCVDLRLLPRDHAAQRREPSSTPTRATTRPPSARAAPGRAPRRGQAGTPTARPRARPAVGRAARDQQVAPGGDALDLHLHLPDERHEGSAVGGVRVADERRVRRDHRHLLGAARVERDAPAGQTDDLSGRPPRRRRRAGSTPARSRRRRAGERCRRRAPSRRCRCASGCRWRCTRGPCANVNARGAAAAGLRAGDLSRRASADSRGLPETSRTRANAALHWGQLSSHSRTAS